MFTKIFAKLIKNSKIKETTPKCPKTVYIKISDYDIEISETVEIHLDLPLDIIFKGTLGKYERLVLLKNTPCEKCGK